LRGLEVTRLAEKVSHPLQREGRDAVSGGSGVVGEGFRPVDQLLVIVRGKEEAAGAVIQIVPQKHFQQLAGELQLIRTEANLLQLQDGIGEERVVVEIRVQLRATVVVSGQEPAVAPEYAAHEVERKPG